MVTFSTVLYCTVLYCGEDQTRDNAMESGVFRIVGKPMLPSKKYGVEQDCLVWWNVQTCLEKRCIQYVTLLNTNQLEKKLLV